MQGEILWLIIICTYLSICRNFFFDNQYSDLFFGILEEFWCLLQNSHWSYIHIWSFQLLGSEFYRRQQNSIRIPCESRKPPHYLYTLENFYKFANFAKAWVNIWRYFLFGPILKKMNQITIPELFNIKYEVDKRLFDSLFWGWELIENTFWDYPNFTCYFFFTRLVIFGYKFRISNMTFFCYKFRIWKL